MIAIGTRVCIIGPHWAAGRYGRITHANHAYYTVALEPGGDPNEDLTAHVSPQRVRRAERQHVTPEWSPDDIGTRVSVPDLSEPPTARTEGTVRTVGVEAGAPVLTVRTRNGTHNYPATDVRRVGEAYDAPIAPEDRVEVRVREKGPEERGNSLGLLGANMKTRAELAEESRVLEEADRIASLEKAPAEEPLQHWVPSDIGTHAWVPDPSAESPKPYVRGTVLTIGGHRREEATFVVVRTRSGRHSFPSTQVLRADPGPEARFTVTYGSYPSGKQQTPRREADRYPVGRRVRFIGSHVKAGEYGRVSAFVEGLYYVQVENGDGTYSALPEQVTGKAPAGSYPTKQVNRVPETVDMNATEICHVRLEHRNGSIIYATRYAGEASPVEGPFIVGHGVYLTEGEALRVGYNIARTKRSPE